MISQRFLPSGRGVARLRVVFGFSLACGLSTLFGFPLMAQTAHFSGAQSAVGSGLSAPAGIALDAAGNIYIADSGASSVVRVPATDPTCTTSGDCTTVGSGLLHPRGVAVDVNGNIYIADSGNSRILKVPSSDLTCLSSCTTVGAGLTNPQGVTVDASGNVYIADTGNARVLLAPVGDLVCATPSDCKSVGTGLTTPTGVALDRLGNVYISDNSRTNVLKVLSTDLTCTTVGDCTTVGAGLSSPYGAVVDTTGNVFIADSGNNRILEVPSTDLTCASPGDCKSVGVGLNGPTGIAKSQQGAFYIADFGNTRALELQLNAVNLGSNNVASTSATLALNFTFDTAGTLNSTTAFQVLTQGITGLDFNNAAGSTCSSASSYNPGDTCVVNVSMTPTTTGTRLGAVVLYGSTGTPIVSGNLYGSGQGAQTTFYPGTQTTLYNPISGSGGVAVDAGGNIYVTSYSAGKLYKLTPSGGVYSLSTIATGLTTPLGIAVDGSGDIFVASSAGLLEFTPSGSGYNAPTTIVAGNNYLVSVAVDQFGNLYYSNYLGSSVYKLTYSNGNYIQTPLGSGWVGPYGVAVDLPGNVYVADFNGNDVVKLTFNKGTYSQSTLFTVGSGNDPTSVALDASGSLYVGVYGANEIIKESPSGGSYTQAIIASGLSPTVYWVALDGTGNLYFTHEVIDATDGVYKINVSGQPSPTLSFATTAVGSTSTDSPQTLNVWNIGNQPLIFTTPGTGTNPAYPSDFPENGSDANLCASGSPLAAGAACDVSIDFSPLAGGSLSESVVLTDNALNVTNATQSINVTGTATGLTLSPSTLPNGTFGVAYSQAFSAGGGTAPYTYSVTAGALPGGLTLNTSTGALTGTPTGAGGFSFTVKALDSASLAASHGYTLTISTGTPTISVTNTPVAYNGSAQAAVVTGSVAGTVSNVQYNGSTTVPTSPGTYAVTANFVPTDTTDYTSLTGAAAGNFVITQATPTLAVTNSPLTYTGSAQTAALSSSVAGTITNVKYNGSSTVPTSAGTYAITADFAPTDTTDYSALTGASAGNLVVNKATPTLSVSNSPVTYTGSAQAATVAGSVAGAASNVKYNGSTTVPTGAATYAVIADFTPTDTTDYASLTGAAAGNFVINKASPAITWATPVAISYGTALSGTQLSASSTVAGAFVYTPTSGTVLGAGTQTLSVTLTPTDTTDYNNATQTVQLTVNQATPVITWATPAAIGYGTALSAAQLNASSTVAGNLVYTPSTGTVLGGGTHTLSVTLTPTDLTDYTTATQTVQITVNKGTPTITWATPAAISYGTALSGAQLNASSAVAGTLVYTPASGTVLGAGTQTLSVTLTPTDTTDYATATQTVQITVNKATPTMTWATPSSITYGTALSATQLDASSTVAGAFVYTPSSGTVPTAGTHTLSVTLTPTDLADYTTATQTVQLTVNQANAPTISWPAPAAITYGTALSATQLDASTTIGGTFVYTPPVGTVLSAGTQTLSVTFTPTDTTDYSNATQTTQITVNKVLPTVTWTTPAAIPYGTALSGTQLNAAASVPGAFVYTPATGTVLGAGTQTLSVTFTPTDATDFSAVTQTVQITVSKATPTITWTAPASITYGTGLSATQLDAASTVAGAFVYNPTAGTVLTTGTHTLSVTLTPTDGADYNTATQTVQITVKQAAAPTITWAAPAAITYGTALSAAQLNASTTIPGTFVYTPAAGAVLNAGTQTLSVTFTPTDSTDYSAATQTAQLTVNKAAQTIAFTPPSSVAYGSGAITLTATGGASGSPVTFSLMSGPATLSGASLSFTGAGTVVLNANQAGNSNYLAATQVTQSIKVTDATLTVSANNASRAYGVANPTFSGTITGAVNGDTFTESFTTTATISSNAGSYAVVPLAAGTNLAEYTVVNQNGTLTVTQAGTTTTLGVSSASINPGQSVTLTATVASATTGTPTGSVNFYDGTTLLGNGTLAAGVATYTAAALASGTHTLTAVYAGDTNFTTSSTTASTSIVVAALDFTLAVSGAPTQTVSQGGAGAYTVVVNPLYGNYAGTVTFAATNLPAGATATFSPTSVAANAGQQTVSVKIQTAAGVAMQSEPSLGRKLAPLGLALLLLPLVGAKRMRRQGRGLSRMLSLVLLLGAMATAVAVTGCGGSVKTTTGNPQTYTITITASTGNLSHSVNLTLDVQ